MRIGLRLLQDLAIPLSAGALLLAGWGANRWIGDGEQRWIVWGLLGLSYLIAGAEPAIRGAALALRGRFDIDFLMVVAALAAAAIGEVVDGGLLLFLFALGHGLEKYAMGQARRAISALGSIAPRTVHVLRNNQEIEVPVESVEIGETVVIRPGERVGVDGRVSAGQSAVDQAPITGESVPVEKSRGDEVFAGTLNGDGALHVTALRVAADSTMARMIRLVEEAQSQKSRVQRAADRFTRIYVPVVLLMVVATATVPPALGWIAVAEGGSAWKEALLRAIALLVGASPCALAISTPAAVLAGVAKAARSGVLIKGGAHLESLALVTAMALDKTGTITRGRPEVTEIIPFDGAEPERVLTLAAALESQSTHPLAHAITTAAESRSLAVPAVTNLVSVKGKGLVGTVEGREIRVGAARLFTTDERSASKGPALPAEVATAVHDLEAGAQTIMVVAEGDRFIGVIALMDRPRPEAAGAIARLQSMGVDPIVMLTGDNPTVAKAIGATVGLRDVRGGLMPEDKIEAVSELARTHRAVAMVGDGVNDAPALAAATIGIAMGGGGTDVALEAADVALIRDDLDRLPFAIALGRASRRVVLQNVSISMGMVGVLIPLAVLGWLPITLAVILHEGSTVAVVLNGLRLLGFRDTVPREPRAATPSASIASSTAGAHAEAVAGAGVAARRVEAS
ncbi:MAG: heavy metal translocating P-type ATPase [Phycisphaeraceae bacterium]|nr:heavy metal translocating P-type ATPase [Phycisphaeraceae bacterium]